MAMAAAVMVVMGLLAVAVQPSMQEERINPLFVTPLKTHPGPAFALITTSTSAEKALNDSGILTVDSYHDILGRRFVVGTISVSPTFGVEVVYVNSANRPSINLGLTLQLMIDRFDIGGIIYFGSAGGVNNSLSLGTVVAPGKIAHTGVWTWKKHGAIPNGQLVFGDYNTPQNGDNLLGSVLFGPSEVYRNEELKKHVFWLTPNERWLWLAGKIEGVAAGLKAASSDIYVRNYEYREFLWHQFKASIVDTTSSAVALAAYSNDKPFIVFRGVSNTAGASDDTNSKLANKNVVKAVKKFIYLATVPRELYEA